MHFLASLSRAAEKLFKLWRSNWRFGFPKQADLLVFDAASAQAIEQIAWASSQETLHARYENINLVCLFKAIPRAINRKMSLSEAYCQVFCDFVRPKVVITSIDTSLQFYKLARYASYATSIVIQNGRRSDFFRNIEPLQFQIDYAFCFSEASGEIYRKYFGATPVVVGSLRCNAITADFSASQDDDVVFVSTWTTPGEPLIVQLFGEPVVWDAFHDVDKIVLPRLMEWCKTNGKLLKILGCALAQSDHEFEYFKDILGDSDSTWRFEPRTAISSNYQKILKSSIVVGTDSTLLSEALALNLKTIVCDVRARALHAPDLALGWPDALEEEGVFWISDMSRFESKLDEVYSMSYPNWHRALRNANLSHSIMAYYPGNTSVMSRLNEISEEKKVKQ